MATKKPSPAQLAARKKFAAAAKSGALAKRRKAVAGKSAAKPKRGKNPSPRIPVGHARAMHSFSHVVICDGHVIAGTHSQADAALFGQCYADKHQKSVRVEEA